MPTALDLDAAVDLDSPLYDLDGLLLVVPTVDIIFVTFTNNQRATFDA